MNKRIGNYILQTLIACGSFGSVFLAKHIHQPKQGKFAVKIIPIQIIKNKQKVLHYNQTEELILINLRQNQHIIHFYERVTIGKQIIMVYEYCQGGTLQQKLKEWKRFPQPKVIQIFTQLLQAFKVLQKHQILHRDVKPDNIMFKKGKVKLADFGLSKMLKEGQTMTETILGSPLYMAPQVVQLSKYTNKADIWSLGLVVYEMLYGFVPFKSTSLFSFRKQIRQQIKYPHKVLVSEKLKTILVRMLEVDHTKRISWQELFEIDFCDKTIQNKKHENNKNNNEYYKTSQTILKQTNQVYLNCRQKTNALDGYISNLCSKFRRLSVDENIQSEPHKRK